MSRRILIVDDSAVMRKIIVRSLGQAGFAFDEVLEASDGYEALHQVKTARPDLVVSDVNMPNMDGFEFVRALNEMNLDPPIPVIMITTEGTEAKIEEARSYGVKGYIAKPFKPEQLREALGKIFAAGGGYRWIASSSRTSWTRPSKSSPR